MFNHIFSILLCICIHLGILLQDAFATFTLPTTIQGTWYFTDGSDLIAFEIDTTHIITAKKKWSIHDISISDGIYQLIVNQNGEESNFYFKPPYKGYIQISDARRRFFWFKKRLYAPNIPHIPLSKLSPILTGNWFSTNSKNEWVISFQDERISWKGTYYSLKHAYKYGDNYKLFIGNSEHQKELTIKIRNEHLLQVRLNSSFPFFVKKSIESPNSIIHSSLEIPETFLGSWYCIGPGSKEEFIISQNSINRINVHQILQENEKFDIKLANGKRLVLISLGKDHISISQPEQGPKYYSNHPHYSEKITLKASDIPKEFHGRWYDVHSNEWICSITTDWWLQNGIFWEYDHVGVENNRWEFIIKTSEGLEKLEVETIDTNHIQTIDSNGNWRKLKRSKS